MTRDLVDERHGASDVPRGTIKRAPERPGRTLLTSLACGQVRCWLFPETDFAIRNPRRFPSGLSTQPGFPPDKGLPYSYLGVQLRSLEAA